MELIRFRHSIAGRTAAGEVLVALIDDDKPEGAGRCVGLLLCDAAPARVLIAGLGSALKDNGEQ